MATTKKAKKLTTTVINKDAKVLDEQLQVIVTSSINGEQYELTIDKVFKKSKIFLLTAELFDTASYAQLNGIDFKLIFAQLSLLALIKHFTSIGNGMPDKLNEQVAFIQKLDDMGLFESIIDAMPQDQVQKAVTQIEQAMEILNNNLSEDNFVLEPTEEVL